MWVGKSEVSDHVKEKRSWSLSAAGPGLSCSSSLPPCTTCSPRTVRMRVRAVTRSRRNAAGAWNTLEMSVFRGHFHKIHTYQLLDLDCTDERVWSAQAPQLWLALILRLAKPYLHPCSERVSQKFCSNLGLQTRGQALWRSARGASVLPSPRHHRSSLTEDHLKMTSKAVQSPVQVNHPKPELEASRLGYSYQK